MLVEDAMEIDNSHPRIEDEIQFDESKVYQVLPFQDLLFLLSILNWLTFYIADSAIERVVKTT